MSILIQYRANSREKDTEPRLPEVRSLPPPRRPETPGTPKSRINVALALAIRQLSLLIQPRTPEMSQWPQGRPCGHRGSAQGVKGGHGSSGGTWRSGSAHGHATLLRPGPTPSGQTGRSCSLSPRRRVDGEHSPVHTSPALGREEIIARDTSSAVDVDAFEAVVCPTPAVISLSANGSPERR